MQQQSAWVACFQRFFHLPDSNDQLIFLNQIRLASAARFRFFMAKGQRRKIAGVKNKGFAVCPL